MSLNGLLDASRRSLRTMEAAMQTAGNNVSNAGTAGYHRRILNTSPASMGSTGVMMRPARGSFTGAGVMIQGYTRARDTLLETASWQAQSGLGGADEGVRFGATLEALLDPETAGSLNGSLHAFWSAWNDAANAPTDTGVRTVLLRQADAVAGAFKRLSTGLGDLEREASAGLDAHVARANDLFAQIASLNQRVAQARAAGTPDLDAEDARDEAVRSLSALAPVRVSQTDDGSYTVTVQGMAVVQGRDVIMLEHTGPPSAPDHGLRFKGTSVAFRMGDGLQTGRLGAGLTALTSTIPSARQALDDLAARLVADVNTAHEAGYGLDGGTGRSFFDPAGTTAAGLALALTDPAHIALAGAPDAPGDTSVGRAIADLQAGFDQEALGLSTANGSRLARARAAADAQGALTAHLDALAAGVGGVSVDEEMTNLIEYQKSYAASARVIQTVQAMFDSLLAL